MTGNNLNFLKLAWRNLWNHITGIYFRLVLVIWNQCASLPFSLNIFQTLPTRLPIAASCRICLQRLIVDNSLHNSIPRKTFCQIFLFSYKFCSRRCRWLYLVHDSIALQITYFFCKFFCLELLLCNVNVHFPLKINENGILSRWLFW